MPQLFLLALLYSSSYTSTYIILLVLLHVRLGVTIDWDGAPYTMRRKFDNRNVYRVFTSYPPPPSPVPPSLLLFFFLPLTLNGEMRPTCV